MDCTNGRLKPFSITAATFNANGLARQRDEIRQFLIDHQVDVLLVQETFLKPGIRDPRVANYNLIRHDRPSNRCGGTCIYYRKSLHCSPIDVPALDNVEVSACRLAMTGHPPLTIVSAYLSPTKSLSENDLKSILSLGNSVLIAGDLNAKHLRWGCHASNQRGLRLESLVDTLNFEIITPLTPTHFPGNLAHRPDVLDIVLLKGVTLALRSIETVHELSSDHRPVLFRLGPHADNTPRTKTVVDWMKLESRLASESTIHLSDVPDPITSPQDTSRAIDALTSCLQSAVSGSSKEVPAEDFRRWRLPEDMRKLLTEKNYATRQYDMYRTDENRARLRSLQRDVKARMQELRDDKWDDLLGEISPTHKAYWDLAKSLKSETVSTMPPLNRPSDGTTAFDDVEKAECLADSLESQCSPSTQPVDPDHVERVDRYVNEKCSLPPADLLSPVTADEVKSHARKLKVRSAPGADGVSNRVIKRLPFSLFCLIAAIFNAAIAQCSFPDAWKEAIVIGIHKPKKPRNCPSSYRPISLLKTLGKLYERVLHARLKQYVLTNNVLIHEQFGFRPEHSCVHQVHRITEHILDGFDHGLKTGALFFDVAKAFDKVWHNGLLYKLFQLKVPDRLVHIIRDFLSNRSFRYRVEGSLSSAHPIRAGVPQGSVLSPLLYSLFTNDIPKIPSVHLALFADDTALYATSYSVDIIIERLRTAADFLGEWFRKWRIEVNPEKSAAIVFSRDAFRFDIQRSLRDKVTMFDRPIPWESSVKYLGVTLDRRMTFRPHIQRVRNRAAYLLGRLYPLIGRRSKMSLRNKLTLYKTCIRPVMTYAGVVFAHVPHTRLLSLQRIQNRFLRRAANAPWYMRTIDLHSDLEIQSIKQYLKEATRSVFERAARHSNPLIANTVSYRVRSVRERYRRPRSVLTDPPDVITAALAAEPPRPSRPPTDSQNHTFALNIQ